MPFDRERRVGWLVPPVLATLVNLPGLNVDRVVGQHRERRHAILAVVLVLVVAPQQHEVGLERIELGADLAEVVDHVAPMLLGVAQPVVGAPLLPHRRVPAGRRSERLGQQRVSEQQLDPPAQVALVRKAGVMGDAEPEDLSHGSPSPRMRYHTPPWRPSLSPVAINDAKRSRPAGAVKSWWAAVA